MRKIIITLAILLAAIGGASVRNPVYAQHETAADLVDGERAFRQTCANCHGPDGDQIQGIDLGRGRFRRPMTDADLVRIIRTGIPNTPMPATQMTEEQASKIVAYLRSRAATVGAASVVGDPARGKTLFDAKGACASCHRVNGTGSRVGPDLSAVGSHAQCRRTAACAHRSECGGPAAKPLLSRHAQGRDDGRQDGCSDMTRSACRSSTPGSSSARSARPTCATRPSSRHPCPRIKTSLSAQELADVVSYLSSLRNR